MIAVVDYGMGNLRSVAKAIQHVAPKETVAITSDAATIRRADRIVFPGQGAMPDCMQYLLDARLDGVVREAAASKPLLAVCIGEQMLFERSDEGDVAGLGIFAGRVIRFDEAAMQQPGGGRLKVPHMGWNRVRQEKAHPLWEGIPDDSWFYFVHSYYVVPTDRRISTGQSTYGTSFTCVVASDNIFATQFHPEKSSAAGLRIYENFTRWNP